MERKIEKQLLSWKSSVNRLPLIVQGPRQVGKTHTLLAFGKSHYKNVIYINFESSLEVNAIFERDLSPGKILRDLSVFTGETILEHESLVFFDEIQACERALTSLKYFAEEANNYHVVAAGSLLGVAVNREKYSFPVGKVNIFTMFPMDFEEFLWALGQKQGTAVIRESFDQNQPCTLHNHFIQLYRTFLSVGGMPLAVKEFKENNDYHFLAVTQKTILDGYVADMSKYASASETVRIMAVFNSLPAQLAKENRKFQFKVIKTGAKAGVYETPMDWLKASGIVIMCQKVSMGTFPLPAHIESSSFKIYFADTGLLCLKYGLSLNQMLSEFSGFDQIKGALAENHVATALVSNGYTPFYWESQGKAEVDFVIQNTAGQVIPVEVKSSENVRSKSLQQFVQKYHPPYSVRISTKNFGMENNIKSIPLYAAFCI
jgi:predicted AAA+ superfamily ATPase